MSKWNFDKQEAQTMQEKGKRALEDSRESNKFAFESGQLVDLIKIIEGVPRSMSLNFGATDQLVHVVDKVDDIVKGLVALIGGPAKHAEDVSMSLLRVFRNLEEKIGVISERLEKVEGASRLTEKARPLTKEENEPDPEPNLKLETKEKIKLEPDAEDGSFAIGDYRLINIPHTVKGNRNLISWSQFFDRLEGLKEIIRQLKAQGVDVAQAVTLKKAGFNSVYGEFSIQKAKGLDFDSWAEFVRSLDLD